MKVLITGASSGIGRALSIEYASFGANLLLIGRNGAELQKTAEMCRRIGAHEVHCGCVDVRIFADVKDFVKNLPEKYKKIDLLVANAGIRAVENNLVDIDAVIRNVETNYYGVVNCVEAFIDQGLINFKAIGLISSIGALRATHNSGAYSASKAAVNKWAGALRLRLKENKIPVTIINLGFVKTEMTQSLNFSMPGLIEANIAARKIRYAFENRKKTTVIPWQSMLIWKILEFLPDGIYDTLIDFMKKRQG